VPGGLDMQRTPVAGDPGGDPGERLRGEWLGPVADPLARQGPVDRGSGRQPAGLHDRAAVAVHVQVLCPVAAHGAPVLPRLPGLDHAVALAAVGAWPERPFKVGGPVTFTPAHDVDAVP